MYTSIYYNASPVTAILSLRHARVNIVLENKSITDKRLSPLGQPNSLILSIFLKSPDFSPTGKSKTLFSGFADLKVGWESCQFEKQDISI